MLNSPKSGNFQDRKVSMDFIRKILSKFGRKKQVFVSVGDYYSAKLRSERKLSKVRRYMHA